MAFNAIIITKVVPRTESTIKTFNERNNVRNVAFIILTESIVYTVLEYDLITLTLISHLSKDSGVTLEKRENARERIFFPV